MPDILVIGAGPAGLAAAVAAGEAGARVRILDENAAPGGQIWRAWADTVHPQARGFVRRLARTEARVDCGYRVFDAPAPGFVQAEGPSGVETIEYDCIVLATGARELFLPFPGWTLPGVLGVGGIQALLKSGADLEGRRVVVSGSGPLLLAVGAALASAGAVVVGVFEQARARQLSAFARRAMSASRGLDAIRYFVQLGLTPYESGVWAVAAEGTSRVESVRLTDGGRIWSEPVDYLACAYGLVPNVELASLLGARVTSDHVEVDRSQRTSEPAAYAAGELAGIGGLEVALAEGELAGRAAAGVPHWELQPQVQRLNRFRAVLAEAFALRREVFELATPETILCRCEDVRRRDVDRSWSMRQAKLYTRLGMGPCQGRVCGAAARCLFGWQADRLRPPLGPTEVNTFMAHQGPE